MSIALSNTRNSDTTDKLVVRPVTSLEHALFRGMYSLYLHDLSEFTDFYKLNADGQWLPDYLPTWLDCNNPEVKPFLFWRGTTPIGFALVGAKPFPYMSAGIDYRMSEFFILRAYRRGGVGRAGAKQVFEMLPGRWEIVQLSENKSATTFWLRSLQELGARALIADTLEGDPRQRFEM